MKLHEFLLKVGKFVSHRRAHRRVLRGTKASLFHKFSSLYGLIRSSERVPNKTTTKSRT